MRAKKNIDICKLNEFPWNFQKFWRKNGKWCQNLANIFSPKDIFLGSVWALSVGVCEMWTTWMCPPVAVPAQPRILAGRRFLRISPNISGHRVVRVFQYYYWSILLAYSAYPVIIAALAPRIRFYLHKEFRAAGIRFFSTLVHKNVFGAFLVRNCWGKWLIYSVYWKFFRAARAYFLR